MQRRSSPLGLSFPSHGPSHGPSTRSSVGTYLNLLAVCAAVGSAVVSGAMVAFSRRRATSSDAPKDAASTPRPSDEEAR